MRQVRRARAKMLREAKPIDPSSTPSLGEVVLWAILVPTVACAARKPAIATCIDLCGLKIERVASD
jgi:hypothetical protein